MNDRTLFGSPEGSRDKYGKLARWLQQVLYVAPPEREKSTITGEGENQLDLLLDSDYHLHFYQQLPDFIMALLTNNPRASYSYAPLLFHLASCHECHSGFLDLYDAMRVAVSPQETRPFLGQGTRSLWATPQRMLGHLCQTLISQAEAVLLQARRDHSDGEPAARSLLQLALHVSARISQYSLRRYALQDLVRVATLADGPSSSASDSTVLSYAPPLTSAGARRGKIVRRADMLTGHAAQEQAVIHLQFRSLDGFIKQQDQMLELHLQGLDTALRGNHVLISIPLGSLIEPIRWLGGNPHAVRSAVPVDATGSLSTPLGEADLHLSSVEDRNLLEAMFMLLEVRPAD